MKGRFLLGVVLGIALGGVVVVALLPEPRRRFRELGTRLTELPGLGGRLRTLAGLGERAIAAARARYSLALAEAGEAREAARRELWAKLEEAKRQGRLPPGG